MSEDTMAEEPAAKESAVEDTMAEESVAASTPSQEAIAEPSRPEPAQAKPAQVKPAQAKPAGPTKLLVIDDDKNMSALISRFLLGFGYDVEVVHDPRLALERLREGGFSLAMVDIVMPHMGGIELVIRIKNEFPKLPVVVMTSYASIQTARRAVQAGADDFVTKSSEGEFWDLRIRKILDAQ